MHRVRQSDINCLHRLIVADAIEVLVAIDRVLGNAILRRDALGLVTMAADQSCDLTALRLLHTPHEMVGDDTQPDNGESDPLLLLCKYVWNRTRNSHGCRTQCT